MAAPGWEVSIHHWGLQTTSAKGCWRAWGPTWGPEEDWWGGGGVSRRTPGREGDWVREGSQGGRNSTTRGQQDGTEPPLSFSTGWLGLAHDLFPESGHICSLLLCHLLLPRASEGWRGPKSNHLPASKVGSLKAPSVETQALAKPPQPQTVPMLCGHTWPGMRPGSARG